MKLRIATCEFKGKKPFCGDGTLDKGEMCDDGNNVSGDGCTDECVVEFCGDGIVQEGLGEECDGGKGCTDDCLIEVVPTMTTWAYIVLALLLLSMGVMVLFRFERLRG